MAKYIRKARNKVKIYSIVFINHGRLKNTICSEKTERAIYKRFKKLLAENKKVVFPVRYNNLEHVMIPSEYEIVILKCRDEFENKTTKVRDDSGEFINYKTDSDDWIVVDRASYEVEETFWVYGYHPRFQRKTFQWVFENFILKNSKDKYMFKSVQVYNNKILIDCNGKLEMVICKNKNDSIRFYNLLEQYAKKSKCKYILFMGDIARSKYKKDWIQRIVDLTSWNIKKVIRRSTRE